MYIESISVIVKKREPATFKFKCENRIDDGFIYILNGTGLLEIFGKKIELKKNMILLFQKNDNYIISASDDKFEYITTAFHINPDSGFRKVGLPVAIEVDENSYLVSKIDNALDIWEKRVPLYLMKSRIVLEQILTDIIDIYFHSYLITERENRIAPALEYINQNYNKNVSVKELSEICGLSETHFRRLFDKAVGLSPIQYRESVRLYWAKHLLETQLFNISEIALKLGYYDIYHFSRNFKKQTGVSPTGYLSDKRKNL